MEQEEMQELEPLSLGQQVERLGAKDWRIAGAAWQALIEAGQAGLEAALRGMAHPQPRVRRMCADFMDHQGTDQCVTALHDAAQNDPVPAVRRAAVHSLGCQRCKASPLPVDTVAFLIERLFAETSIRVRREAVAGLMFQPPDERAAAALRTVLQQETDRELRRLAHYSLQRHDPAYRQEVIAQAKARGLALHRSKADAV
jgi:HEAT repeat protein